MALADPIQIEYSTEDPIFVSTKNLPDGRQRLNQATSIQEPETLTVRHQVSGSSKAGNLADRHLVQFSRVEINEETGVAQTAQVNVTMVVPRAGTFSSADMLRMVDVIASFLTSSDGGSVRHATRVLRGES